MTEDGGTFGAQVASAARWPLDLFEELPSTNAAVKKRLRAGEQPPFAVLAFRQSAGYGRQGRKWSSPFGGLYVSFGYRAEVDAAMLSTASLVVALAVREALIAAVPAAAGRLLVKWPNDLVVRDNDGFAKLCGISLETCAKALCVGIGVNVFPSKVVPDAAYPVAFLTHILPEDGDFAEPALVAHLAADDANREFWRAALVALAHRVIEQCARLLGEWSLAGFAPLVERYNVDSALRGAFIEVADIEGRFSHRGIAGEVAADGRLGLVTEAGETLWLSSGEAHLTRSLYPGHRALQ